MRYASFLVPLLLILAAPAAAAEKEESAARTLAASQGISEDEAAQRIKAVFTAVADELHAGRSVTIRRFGRFYVKHRDARTARNPRSGEPIEVPAKRYPRFSSSEVLKDRLNQS